MVLKYRLKNITENFLKIVYKNYKGQVAIFVALIFQIVFILFALMINVGLLVHHKINLQQSTDLAAYYGAMKQAEMLNVVGHVNFQIRQAFKLLTWRYRILGTFGFEHGSNNGPWVKFPLEPIYPNETKAGNKYNPDAENFICHIDATSSGAADDISPLEIPFMCLNHYGFKESISPNNQTETFCKVDCNTFNHLPTSIPNFTAGASAGLSIPGVGIVNVLQEAINNANDQVKNACDNIGPISTGQLVKFYLSYLQDTKNKMLFIKVLLANLSADEKEMLDIEGNKIYEGTLNTFKNNLTEANNTSMSSNIFETYNSISPTHGGDCSYNGISNTTRSASGNATLFAEINFQFIQYFLLLCNPNTDGSKSKDFAAGSLYDNSVPIKLNTDLMKQLVKIFGQTTADRIQSIMTMNYYDHTIGIEKNPWCPIYYGVKATSTPIIPFLPISKITLHASAFAKPFGGSIGPRQYNEWESSANNSKIGTSRSAQLDSNLPIQNLKPTAAGGINSLKDNRNILLNYSNYVGDTKGLADPKLAAVYYDILSNRVVGNAQAVNGKELEPTATSPNSDRIKPQKWPSFLEWDNITKDINDPDYDALAFDTAGKKNSFMRDIELSVVAPNQFETTYYSIEPDFYNVYVKNKLDKGFNKIKDKVGLSGTQVYIPKDFGNHNGLTGITDNFSVRNQLEIVQSVMRGASPSTSPTSITPSLNSPPHASGMDMSMYFTYIPFLQGSLLTSWTMKDLISDDFSQIIQNETTMPFGKCDDTDLHGDNSYGSIAELPDPKGGSDKLPPAPGNCIRGGRTGYSVKIVSPASLFSDKLKVGTSTGSIRNPPTGFVTF